MAQSDDDILEEAKELFEEAREHESHNRKEALDDLRFARLGEQWPLKVRQQREKDGRPCLTINRLPSIIRQVVNDARQNKPSITVHPVDSNADPDTAKIFTGLIRNIEQSSDAEVAYDTALDFAVTSGVGYFRINTRYADDESFDQDIVIERIANPFSVYGDPNSTAADSSDWDTCFVVDAMPKTTLEKRYKGAEAVDWASDIYAGLQEPWRDGERVMLAEYWKREQVMRQIVALTPPTGELHPEHIAAMSQMDISDRFICDLEVYKTNKPFFDSLGVKVMGQPRPVSTHKVTQYVMTGAEVLETVNWAGRFIPIVPVYGEEVFVDGRRYFRSLVRDAKDPQRMHNYWRTTSTELVALAPKAPWIGKKGTFNSAMKKWLTANTDAHAFIEYDGEPPQRQPFAGVPAGALQEATNAADDIRQVTGLHQASLGEPSNETSGKAIMARQREGDVSTFHYIDNLSRAIRHAGRITIDLIPKVYSAPRVVRILGDDGGAQLVPVNQKFMEPQQAAPGQPGAPPAGPQGIPDQGDAKMMREIEKIYDLRAGRYDLTVRSGPSFTSRREEAATQMMALIQAFPPAAPVIGDLLVKNLDWPGADDIAERLKALLPPELKPDAPDPKLEQAKMVVQKLQEALQKATQDAMAAKGALAQTKGDQSIASEQIAIDKFRAETERLKALMPAGGPPDPALIAEAVGQVLAMMGGAPPGGGMDASGIGPALAMAGRAATGATPPPQAPGAPQGEPDGDEVAPPIAAADLAATAMHQMQAQQPEPDGDEAPPSAAQVVG